MIEIVHALWNEGKTISEIAERLGKSNGQVAGVMYRAKKKGFVFNKHKLGANLEEKRITKKAKILAKAPHKIFELDDDVSTLKFSECRYILNSNRYCRAPISRVSYCSAHALLCFRGPK